MTSTPKHDDDDLPFEDIFLMADESDDDNPDDWDDEDDEFLEELTLLADRALIDNFVQRATDKQKDFDYDYDRDDYPYGYGVD